MNKCFNPGTKDLYWCSGKGYVSSGISGGWFWIPDSSVTSEWVLGYTDEGSPIYADVLTTQDPGFWIFLGGGGGDGTANSSGMPQQPSKLAQTLDRAKTCAKAYYGFNTLPGAATDVTRVGTLLAAAPLPKSLLSGVGIRTTTLAGGSSFTNILSVLGQGAGTAASGANIFRIAGRMAGPIAIASAVIDVAAIGVCTVIDQ